MTSYLCYVRPSPLMEMVGLEKYLYDITEDARVAFDRMRALKLSVSSFLRVKNRLPADARHLAKAQAGFLHSKSSTLPDVLHMVHTYLLTHPTTTASAVLLSKEDTLVFFSLDTSYAHLYSELLNPAAVLSDSPDSYSIFDEVKVKSTGERAVLVGIREGSVSVRFKNNCCRVMQYEEIQHAPV